MNFLTQFQKSIFEVRGRKVMLDRDVAAALGVVTGELNRNAKQSVKWERARDDENYRFQLTKEEAEIWKNSISSDFTKLPWAYTQRGCTLFAASLESEEACSLALDLVDVFVAYQNGLLAPRQLLAGDYYEDGVKITRSVLEMYKLLGATESTAKVEAVLAVRREYPQIDCNKALENNTSDIQEKWGTPTIIGRKLEEKLGGKYSAVTVNKMLWAARLQEPGKEKNTWVLTARAVDCKFAEYHSIGKKHSNGTQIQQIKWYLDRTLKELIDRPFELT